MREAKLCRSVDASARESKFDKSGEAVQRGATRQRLSDCAIRGTIHT